MGQTRRAALAWLLALSLLLSACTITLFEEGDSTDHTHGEGTDEHDHADEGAVGIDHHGNPIYAEDERVYEQVVVDGVSVEFTVENFLGVGGRGGEVAPRLVAGEHANLQFHITDAATGQPIAGLNPAVWLDVAGGNRECSDRIGGYLAGTLESRPTVDLNSYFILGMNRDSTISVLDPMIDVGGMTNLFSVIILQAIPQDWAMATGRNRLFVTMPTLDSVAVVDLNAFLVEDTVSLPDTPERIALSPDGDHVWVTLGGAGGVAVIDADTLEVATVPTGTAAGPIAFSRTGDRAIIGTGDGTMLVGTADLEPVGQTGLGAAPGGLAVSGATGTAFATLPGAGLISILDLGTGSEIGRLLADPGVTDIEISPDGEWGVAVNPQEEKAYVIEAARNRITHAVPVAGVPDQVTFTDDAAYIHTSGSPSVTVIPLDEIDPTGDISVLTVPIGDRPSGLNGASVVADAIAATPDGNALLIPNPADDTVYFYTEGSQAALGGFQGHTLEPRAVTVVDRSLKEPSPGVYTGSIRIPQGGDYVVAFLLKEPDVTHCFTFSANAAEDPDEGLETLAAELEVVSGAEPVAGAVHEMRFQMTDGATREAMTGIPDVVAKVIQTGSNWNTNVQAVPDGDGYVVTFTPPSPGLYTVLFAVPSLGIGFDSLPQVNLRAG
jgi:DNA-binding beta-propeller fold protein YncE